ncbi:hypothetical protein, partial [Actinomadura fibrosa]|uniref:hypothetical protein n=1 Tax=Actinomadura fibrosa TaxID=111802 RepID=UPI001A95606A
RSRSAAVTAPAMTGVRVALSATSSTPAVAAVRGDGVGERGEARREDGRVVAEPEGERGQAGRGRRGRGRAAHPFGPRRAHDQA